MNNNNFLNFLRMKLTSAEWVRFTLAGLWNSFFGWTVFSLLWLFLKDWANLWIIGGLAHLTATTQAFFVQRQFVFEKTGEAAIQQYFRFQFAYAVQLAIGLIIINALAVQGIHPLVTQPLAMLVLALCGFFLGKTLVFSSNLPRLGVLLRNIYNRLSKTRLAWMAFFVSLVIFEKIWGGRFYSSVSHLGHDFALAGVGLLEGGFWIESNGLMAGLFNPPWFTPAWCAGSTLYADPQAAFYSPLQFLALWVDPFTASHLNALLFATVAFWGGYALARKIFLWAGPASTVFAVLGMANACMPLHSAIGEVGYQPLYIWTLLTLSLCWPASKGRSVQANFWPIIYVAVCLTAWLQFGFGGMMVPTFLATLLLCFALIINNKASLKLVTVRAALGGILAVALNGSKLFESISLMQNFPRNFYDMPGFPNLSDALVAIVLTLIQPSEWSAFFGYRRLARVQFTVFPHEWALEFGLGALAVALLGGLVLLMLRRRDVNPPSTANFNFSHYFSMAGIIIISLVPPLLLWDQGSVRTLLKHIPILNSTAWPMRWIVLYLPLIQLMLALPIQRLLARISSRHTLSIVAGAVAFIWIGPATAPLGYYFDQNIQSYNPMPVVNAFNQLQSKGVIPIQRIAKLQPEQSGLSRNDTMLQGASQGLCYNPIYGYRLESFPQIERLHEGEALQTDASGQSLLFNPACLVHPKENACKPGDGFRMSDPVERVQAELFLSRHPYIWKRPYLGLALGWLSQLLFWTLLTFVIFHAWNHLLRAARPTKL